MPRAKEEVVWLCRPGLPHDPCDTADLAMTVVRGDGTRSVVAPERAEPAPAVDCFYVYPTVDLELVPGNHEDRTSTARPLAATTAQVGPLRGTCALWVPVYRQVTLGTYLQPRDVLEAGLRIAEADVDLAFRDLLRRADPARKIVLIGHSQGGEMVLRLLRRYFDPSPELRGRLLLAMAIGAEVEVPVGRTTGGTLANVPICTRPGETSCVVAYRTHGKSPPTPGRFAPAPGRETACVNPTTLDGERARMRRAVFPVRDGWGTPLAPAFRVTTPFVAVDDFYRAECRDGGGGYRYLEVVAAEDDPRGAGPIELEAPRFRRGALGLHVLDVQLASGDLVELVRRRAGR